MQAYLNNPEIFSFTGANGEKYFGGSQEWYEDRWQKVSGCGPVAASNLAWYLTKPQGGMERYLELMREMFTCVTPGMHGVSNAALFIGGIVRYAEKNGLRLTPQTLEIPPKPRRRPGLGIVREFIVSALQADAPIAFLNRSNGSLNNLDNWHWVTIVSLDADTMRAEVCDYGKKLVIDIAAWQKTSVLGGALVCLGDLSVNLK